MFEAGNTTLRDTRTPRCLYQLEPPSIHVFTFVDNSDKAADDYVTLWEAFLPRFWQADARFDGVLRILTIVRQRGILPFSRIYQHSRQILPRYTDIPPTRIAYVYHSFPQFESSANTYAMITRQQDRANREFFPDMGHDAAIEWLMQDTRN